MARAMWCHDKITIPKLIYILRSRECLDRQPRCLGECRRQTNSGRVRKHHRKILPILPRSWELFGEQRAHSRIFQESMVDEELSVSTPQPARLNPLDLLSVHPGGQNTNSFG